MKLLLLMLCVIVLMESLSAESSATTSSASTEWSQTLHTSPAESLTSNSTIHPENSTHYTQTTHTTQGGGATLTMPFCSIIFQLFLLLLLSAS